MRRRDFLRTIGFGGACLFSKESFQAKPEPTRPNILLIMADDLGFSDLGSYGSEIATPNLDRLAHTGMRFTQFYNAARCCPSRASLMTGLYPHRTGLGHMWRDFGLPAYRGHLNDRCVTIAELLRAAGYRTYMSGKWHLGTAKEHLPNARGFERFFGTTRGGGSYFRPPDLTLDGGPIEPAEGFYYTDAIADWAIRFLRDHPRGATPFFLYVAFTAPHFPLHALPEDIAKYRGGYSLGWDAVRRARHARMIELGIIDERWRSVPRDEYASAWESTSDKAAQDLAMAVYAAQVESMDRAIGRILGAIRTMGVKDNTLVLFLSDNGGCAEAIDRGKADAPAGTPESFKSYGLPWAQASNTPFRLYKHWVHEGGIATPLIVHWPAVMRQANRVTHQVGHIIDILPTCLEAAGVEYPTSFQEHSILPAEGTSLLPVLRGGSRPGHGFLCWEHEGNRAVREGKWKLVAGFRQDWELYDLETDRTETRDLASKFPDRVRRLADLYEEWAKRNQVVSWTEEWEKKFGIPK